MASAAFSPIMMVGALRLPEVTEGMIEESTTRRASTPNTRACVRLTREIFAQTAFDPYRGREIQPGADAVSDEAIDAFVRQHVESAYHPSCTCKMGAKGDPTAVVDSQARVFGVEALRVVDSSIMPSVTSGNLNAPTIMIGEKAADLIRGQAPLAASNAPYFEAPDWRTAQR